MDPGSDLLDRARQAARAELGAEPIIAPVAWVEGRATSRAEQAGYALAITVYRDPERLEKEVEYSALARDLGIPVPPQVAYEPGPPGVLVTGWVGGVAVDWRPKALWSWANFFASITQRASRMAMLPNDGMARFSVGST